MNSHNGTTEQADALAFLSDEEIEERRIEEEHAAYRRKRSAFLQAQMDGIRENENDFYDYVRRLTEQATGDGSALTGTMALLHYDRSIGDYLYNDSRLPRTMRPATRDERQDYLEAVRE